MAPYTYELDDRHHISHSSNLKLTTKCSLKITSSQGQTEPFPFIFKQLDSILSFGVWVTGSSKLQLSVQVSGIDFSLLNFDPIILVDCLGDVIHNAEVMLKAKSP